MFKSVRDGGFVYELLGQQNLQGAIDCVSQVFTQSEPLAHHLGITYDEFTKFAGAYYPKIAEDGLSLVAKDEASGRIIGVRVSEDFIQEGEPPELDISPKFFAIFSLLDQLGEYFKEIRQIQPGQYAHMFMVAVDERFTNQGIAPAMNRLFFEHVRGMGFTHLVTEPTGQISQHVLKNKFGFNELHRIYYRDYEFDGTKIFADIQDHEFASLMEREIPQ